MDSGTPALAAPRYAIQPRKPSEAPTLLRPTISAPHSPMSICGPYRKNPIINTMSDCATGMPAGTAWKARSIAATPTRYAITTWMRFPTAPPSDVAMYQSLIRPATSEPKRPPSSRPETRSAAAPASTTPFSLMR